MLYNHSVRLLSVNIVGENTVRKLRSIWDLLSKKQEEAHANFISFLPAQEDTSLPGRPKFRITESQLSYLIDSGFSGVDMARMLGVSESTVHRRLRDMGINTARTFSEIDDSALDEAIVNIKRQAPNAGYRMILGHLRADGLFVQQLRVRESLQRVDPHGTTSRWLSVTERRKYNVVCPNALWHIDGNHKLVRQVIYFY